MTSLMGSVRSDRLLGGFEAYHEPPIACTLVRKVPFERDDALDCREGIMANDKGPNIKKKQKCKNCEGKGLLKKGDRVVKCQRCKGTGLR
jgi:hypothetical protein